MQEVPAALRFHQNQSKRPYCVSYVVSREIAIGSCYPYGMQTLHYGKSKKPLAWVKPDDRYPTMWRIHWADGSVSDMVNLTRAKDAAMAIAERGPPRLERRIFRWQTEVPRERATGGLQRV
jgi:hypothetical protein